MTDQNVAGCSVVDEGCDNFSLHRGNTGDHISFDIHQAVELSLFLQTWLCNHYGLTVLLVGGPRHGDFITIPRDQGPIIVFPAMNTASWVKLDHDYPQDLCFTQHIYRRAEDILLFGQPLPFVLYEHDSLIGANVDREAKRLDSQIEGQEASLSILQEEVVEAKRVLDAAHGRVDNALVNRDETSSDLQESLARRLDIHYKHGI